MMYASEMIEASRGQVFCGMTDREQLEFYGRLLHRLYDMKGIEANEKDIPGWVDELTRETRSRYKGITTDEISLAMKYGLAENFTKDTRLVGSNFLLWIERYMTHPDRLSAVADSRIAEQRQTARLEDNYEERERKRQEFLLRAPRREWEKYKELGRLDITIDGYAAAVYDALVERGKLNATEPTKAKAREIAQAQLRQEAQRRKGISSAIAAGLEFGHGEDYRTKKVLLGWYFENLRKRGIDLS